VKQKVYFSELVFNVDGSAVRTLRGLFPAPAVSVLEYDYVTVGNHVIKLFAYGTSPGASRMSCLYKDSTSINPGTNDPRWHAR